MSQLSYSEALERADLIFDRPALEQAMDRMAAEINRDLAGQQPLLLTVLHGALQTSALLSLRLDLDLEFDYLHATRYRGATVGGALHWLARPQTPLTGRVVLLVDDILDEGYTLVELESWCLAQGAAEVRIAVMCQKAHDRRAIGARADYVGVVVPDRYVFGFGMDYHSHGRHLPGIYAI